MQSKTYTLITGGSMGIGRAFALEFAERGHDILLVALDDAYLSETHAELTSKFQVEVISFGVDLSAQEGPDQVWNWVQENGYTVNILINNAGYGRNGLLESKPWPELDGMIQLNNRAMVKMTYLFLPMLKSQPGNAYMLTMSSMEVPLILPYKAVYAASKNFVYAFSLALREELKSFGVSVTTVCPGPVITNEDGLKRIKTQGKKAKLLVVMPDQVASEAVEGLLKGKQVVVPGRVATLISNVAYWIPRRLKMPFLEKQFRQYKEE